MTNMATLACLHLRHRVALLLLAVSTARAAVEVATARPAVEVAYLSMG